MALTKAEHDARYKARHPDRVRKKILDWCRRNPEKRSAIDKAYRERNKAEINKRLKERRAANGNHSRRQAARSAAKINATPMWGQDGIADVYKEAEYQQMYVDHIIPLRSKLVCGLHVWENLQLLTPTENMKKGNKFNPTTYQQPEINRAYL